MNRILYAEDCLRVLKDPVALPNGSVDLIYLDPPFNSKSIYNLPFRGQYRNAKPVEAFKDTWTWGSEEDEYLTELEEGPEAKNLADIIHVAKEVADKRVRATSLAAYLINMTVRLIAMKHVLKEGGSIYLHCDHTASHYLKIIMDVIWGAKNFRNEIVWHYTGGGRSKSYFSRKHDVLLCYSKSGKKPIFNIDAIRVAYKETSGYAKSGIISDAGKRYMPNPKGTPVDDVWDMPIINPMSKERLGYPTQKPIALLERIIKASSNEGDLVLDPFCGCGTTAHAAESLKRKWIGIDISAFAVGLIRERLSNNFLFNKGRIETKGTPQNLASAEELAKRNKFEFEKWVCGEIGAHGMFHDPGDKGPDRGIDGVIEFYSIRELTSTENTVEKSYAIVQVKGGKVTPDSVRALYATVKNYNASAGVFVCFNKYMKTVENNKNRETFENLTGKYPVIQGFSIEQLLNNEKPKLPPTQLRKNARLRGDLF